MSDALQKLSLSNEHRLQNIEVNIQGDFSLLNQSLQMNEDMSLGPFIASGGSFSKLCDIVDSVPAGFTLVRNETGGNFSFDLLSEEQLFSVFQKNQRGLVLHEILGNHNKIFFDVDLLLNKTCLNNKDIIEIITQDTNFYDCQEISILEQYILRTIQMKITEEFTDTFGVELVFAESNIQQTFDCFRNSRPKGDDFKISWHLVLLPEYYYMRISELKLFAKSINNKLNKAFSPLYPFLSAENSKQLSSPIDIQVYRKKGSIRMPNCAKLGETTKKSIYSIGGVLPIQKDEYCELIEPQLPSRFMVSKLTTQSGFPLKCIQSDCEEEPIIDVPVAVTSYDMCPLSLKQISQILENNNLKNCTLDKPVQQGDLFHIRMSNHSNNCILCDRLHTSDNMYIIINTKIQYLEIRCFRQKGIKGIKFDYNGHLFLDEIEMDSVKYCVQDNQLQEVINHQEVVQSGIVQGGSINKIKDECRMKLNENYESRHETIDTHKYGITVINKNEPDLTQYPESFSKLYVKSHMGTSKTKRLLEYIITYINKNPEDSIYIMSFRITFSKDLVCKLNEYLQNNNRPTRFKSYQEFSDGKSIDAQYLVIQVESLNKLSIKSQKCGLMVIDESESIYEQLTSGLSKKESINFSVFCQLLKNSQQVVCMDAYLSQRSIELTEILSTNDQKQNQLPKYLIKNKWQRTRNYVIYQQSKRKDLWLHDLISSFEDGEHIVVPCNSATVAEVVYKLLISSLPEKRHHEICLYTQHHNKEQKENDIQDLQESWKRYKVLIYSPTISAGVSYEMDHFSRVFAYFDIRSTNMETFFQMIGRVRNIASNTYHVLLSGQSVVCPCTTKGIHESIVKQLEFSCSSIPTGLFFTQNSQGITVSNNDYYQLILHNTRIKNLTLQAATQRFNYLAGNNVSVFIKTASKEQTFQYRLDGLIKELKEQKFNNLKSAENIDNSQIEQLAKQNEELKQLTPQQQLQIQKFYALKSMKIPKNPEYLENMRKSSEMDIWKQKCQYIEMRSEYLSLRQAIRKFRLQSGILRDAESYEFEQIMKQSCNFNKHRVFENLLSIIACNLDVMNATYSHTRKSCKNSCNCIKQHYDIISASIQQFAVNVGNVSQLITQLVDQGIDPKKLKQNLYLLHYSDSTQRCGFTHKVFKNIRQLLGNVYGIYVNKYASSDFYIVTHKSNFGEFIASSEIAESIPRYQLHYTTKLITYAFYTNKSIQSYILATREYPLVPSCIQIQNDIKFNVLKKLYTESMQVTNPDELHNLLATYITYLPVYNAYQLVPFVANRNHVHYCFNYNYANSEINPLDSIKKTFIDISTDHN